MFPEHRLLNEQLNTFNRIVVTETCIIVVTKVVWIGQMIEIHFAGYPTFNPHRIGHFV